MTATGIAQTADSSASHGLTQEELEQGRLLLQQTHDVVAGATRNLSAAQWSFKPGPDRWSIAENLDHIVTVQERVLGPVLDQLANAPAPPEGFARAAVDSVVIHHLSSRLKKFQAPEIVRPLGEIQPPELLQRLAANYASLRERLESTPGLRQHVLPSPPLKAVSQGAYDLMDGYQWILAAAAHTERHAKQILEVTACAGYPA